MMKVITLFVALCTVVVAEEQYVPCQYTSHCKCPSTATVCVFDLVVEELSLFRQYPKNDLSLPVDTRSAQYCTVSDDGDYVKQDGSPCACESSSGCFGPIIADGMINRTFIAINRGLPGPTLIVHEDQVMIVNLENRYSDNVSIHWHGMHQNRTNWMDGVDSVTQFGVYPGRKFRYIFNPRPTGTFWYHAHSELQRVDGFFGALIIMEKTIDPSLGIFIDLPELYTMTLLDWSVEEDEDALVTYSSDGAEVGTDPYASGLVNGKGRHPESTASQLSTFTVSANQRYRFRVIGVQSLYGYRFSIDGHKLKLIATDGAFVQPQDVDYIIIHAGERYDFILETKRPIEVSVQKNFMIRAETLEIVVDDHASYLPNVVDPSYTYNLLLNHSAEAILRYDSTGDIRVTPDQQFTNINQHTGINSSPITCSQSTRCLAVNCPFKKFPDSYYIDCLHVDKLTPLNVITDENELPMSFPDKTLFLNFAFEGPNGDDSINGRSMSLPSYPPSLVSANNRQTIDICTNLDDSSQCDDTTTEENCRCSHIASIGRNETIRMVLSMVRVKRSITLPEEPPKYFAHPVHLHGHYFHVVDIQFGDYYDESGRLTTASSEPRCLGSRNACTNPEWTDRSTNIATGDKYTGSNGRINGSYPLKDTILIPAGGYAVVYFRSNNPGIWFLHCHIGDHQVTGMAMAISEDAASIPAPPTALLRRGENFNWTLDEFYGLYDNSNGAILLPSATILVAALVLNYYLM